MPDEISVLDCCARWSIKPVWLRRNIVHISPEKNKVPVVCHNYWPIFTDFCPLGTFFENFVERILISIFQPNPDCKLLIAILIAIEKLIRINRTLIENFQANPDFKFLSRLWFRNFNRTLIATWIRWCPCKGNFRRKLPLSIQSNPDLKSSTGSRFQFFKQTLISIFPPDLECKIFTAIRIAIEKFDPDQSNPDLKFSTGSWLQFF